MTRLETPFAHDGELVIVPVTLRGRRTREARFVLDTGAEATTIVPELVGTLGYSPRDGFQRTAVRSALGEEAGYLLRVNQLTALRVTMLEFPVNVFDLGHDIDGLLGMNFLNELNYEVRSSERRILVEQAAR